MYQPWTFISRLLSASLLFEHFYHAVAVSAKTTLPLIKRRGQATQQWTHQWHHKQSHSHSRRHHRKHRRLLGIGIEVDASNVEVDAYPAQNEAFWAVPVFIGGQQLDLNIDTGSSLTVLAAGVYQPGPTSVDLQYNGSTRYVSQSTLTGNMYRDQIALGQTSGQQLIAENVTLLSLDAHQKQDFMLTGLLGLGWPYYTPNGTEEPTFLQRLQQQGQLSGLGFTLSLQGDVGTLTLNDQGEREGTTYVPADTSLNVAWEVASTSTAFVNPLSEGNPAAAAPPGIGMGPARGAIDIGSTLLVFASPLVRAFAELHNLSLAPDSGYLYGPTFKVLPIGDCGSDLDVSFDFVGSLAAGSHKVSVKIDPRYLWSDPIAEGPMAGKCYSTIVGIDDTPEDLWILGQPLFQSATITFDYVNRRVGFSAA